jgi:hypothetical protein
VSPHANQIGYVAQGHPEIFDLVQGQASHDMVELSGIGELLDPRMPEDGTFGHPRVDCGHAVVGTHEGPGQLPLSTTNFQNPGRRVTDPAEYELLDVSLPSG